VVISAVPKIQNRFIVDSNTVFYPGSCTETKNKKIEFLQKLQQNFTRVPFKAETYIKTL